ncbi:MAG: N-6 DNA methylase, partial [Acidobacteria bacterium]|nr:N-6 DNA methylase [Acidobacteriota bacterium]
ARFEQAQAVQYFYEPFLEAFDPELRKQLGVWYTPQEIVRYMVERTDRVLREELGLEQGLADERVYVLDPCCGTGAYLVEVLRRIKRTIDEAGGDALGADDLKRAATGRVFGFEILPAPFVVAHLQLGLLLQAEGSPLADDERVGVYLTNALTGWEPPAEPKKQLPFAFHALEEERDAAERVKRDAPILVVIGNPPYNAFAGTSAEEEGGLVEAYKQGLAKEWGIKKFNLDDLYVRFFRLAERRIAEQTGRGVVCFISNFSYLSDPSFVVLRRKFLGDFDKLWFDSLNGDSRETGKLTPEGKPDPSIFSTQYNREGIRVGTAIALMARTAQHGAQPQVRTREFWGATKRQDLLDSLDVADFNAQYEPAHSDATNRYSFRASEVSAQYQAWVKLTDLCAESPSNGLMEKRGGALIDIDRDALEKRMKMYFDASVDWGTLRESKTGLTEDAARFDAQKARGKVLASEHFEASQLRRYALRPFDTRHAYYSPTRPLWNEPRPTLWAQCWEGNSFLMSRPAGVANPEGVPLYFTSALGDNDSLRGHAYYFPLLLRTIAAKRKKIEQQISMLDHVDAPQSETTANLSPRARTYLAALGVENVDEDEETAALVWMHALATGYAPAYLAENADGIRADFPRVPLPATRELLEESAALGRQVAALLDTETHVTGVTSGAIRPELRHVASVRRSEGVGALNPQK